MSIQNDFRSATCLMAESMYILNYGHNLNILNCSFIITMLNNVVCKKKCETIVKCRGDWVTLRLGAPREAVGHPWHVCKACVHFFYMTSVFWG